MKIGDKFRSLELSENPDGTVNLKVWDCCDFCEIDLNDKDLMILSQVLTGVRCHKCGEIVDNRIGSVLPVIEIEHTCKVSE